MKKYLIFLNAILVVICSIEAQNCVVAEYPFNGNANDTSGNNLHGTVSGATLTVNRFGDLNSAYLFDGVNDMIKIGYNSLFNFGANDDFTVSLWTKTSFNQVTATNNNRNMLITQFSDIGFNPTGFPFSVRINNQNISSNNGKVYFDRKATNSCSQHPVGNSNATINDQSWHHLVAQKSGSSLKIFVDNTLESVFNDSTSCTTKNSFDLYIAGKGGTVNPGYYSGVIDDIIIYDCAIDSTTIDSLFSYSPYTGISDIENNHLLSIFPNPASDVINIKGLVNNERTEIAIHSISGQVVRNISSSINNGVYQINTERMQKGVYVLSIKTNRKFWHQKIIIE